MAKHFANVCGVPRLIASIFHRAPVLGLHFVVSTSLTSCGASTGAPTQGNPSRVEPSTLRDNKFEYASVLIPNVPHVMQKPDFCGEAVVESWLKALGVDASQDQVFALSGMNPERGMGATTRELKSALQRLGFNPGPVWYTVDAESKTELDTLFGELHSDLMQKIPSIVCSHFDERPDASEHFRLILGYDAETDEIIYHEPAIANAGYRRMSRRQFLSLWPLKYQSKQWTIIRMRLAGEKISAPGPASGITPADFAQHILSIRQRKARGMSVVLEPPFVVIGDGEPAAVHDTAQHAVRWASTKLKSDFFSKDPQRILDIWLFKNDTSYNSNTRSLLGTAPDTPFGFYNSEHNALIMNIATGGGTLVHEMVHPYIEANFPNCPAWFNEGLGSLFEQSAERDGHIVGLTNWRLAGLQRAIRRGRLQSFSSLMSTTQNEFYEADPGTHYAQARYLLYYLQERGLLVRYYHHFVAHQAQDATGQASLREILGESDLAEFQKRWEPWVLGLRFP